MPASVGRLFGSLYGGTQPRDVAWGLALGILAGFVTGWNLTLAIVLLAFVLFNAHTKTFLAAWGGAWGAGCLLSSVCAAAGKLLLDSTPVGWLVGALGDGPLVALLDWDRYSLMGGLAIGAAMAAITHRAVTRGATVLERRLRAQQQSATNDGARTGQRLGLGALAARTLIYGASSRSRVRRLAAAPRRLRPLGVPAGLAFAATVAWLPWSMGAGMAQQELLRQLSQANQAEVTAETVRLSLWTGDLVIRDLQLADPRRLDRDRLRIGRLTARVAPGRLLRGQFHTGELKLQDIRGDIARRQPAKRMLQRLDPLEAPSVERAALAAHEVELHGYLNGWPAVRQGLARMGRLVSGLEAFACGPTNGDSRGPGRDSTSLAAATRSNLGRPAPRVRIEKLRAENFASTFGLGHKALLELTRLGDPSDDDEPSRLDIIAPEYGAEIYAELNLRRPGERHPVKFRVLDARLRDLIEREHADGALQIAGGEVALLGEGLMDAERMDLEVQIEIQKLDARLVGHSAVAGLTPDVWSDGLKRLGSLRAELRLAGPWTAPALTTDTQRLVEHLKHQLRSAGEHQLVATIDTQLSQPELVAQATASRAADDSPPEEPAGEGFFVSDRQQTARPNDGLEASDRQETLRLGAGESKALTAASETAKETDAANSTRESLAGASKREVPGRYPETFAPRDEDVAAVKPRRVSPLRDVPTELPDVTDSSAAAPSEPSAETVGKTATARSATRYADRYREPAENLPEPTALGGATERTPKTERAPATEVAEAAEPHANVSESEDQETAAAWAEHAQWAERATAQEPVAPDWRQRAATQASATEPSAMKPSAAERTATRGRDPSGDEPFDPFLARRQLVQQGAPDAAQQNRPVGPRPAGPSPDDIEKHTSLFGGFNRGASPARDPATRQAPWPGPVNVATAPQAATASAAPEEAKAAPSENAFKRWSRDVSARITKVFPKKSRETDQSIAPESSTPFDAYDSRQPATQRAMQPEDAGPDGLEVDDRATRDDAIEGQETLDAQGDDSPPPAAADLPWYKRVMR